MTLEIRNSVSVPKYLDVKFFQEVLENGLPEAFVDVKNVSIEMGSGGGDNYCSQIYRVKVTFQPASKPVETVSVIVKSIPVTEGTQFLADLKVFLKEKIFYDSVLPRMEVLLDNVKFGARLYHAAKEPTSTLVFEDLSTLPAIMADREAGLDLNHCQVVMRKLGQFHGVSMVLQRKDPEVMNSFQNGMLAEEVVRSSAIYDTFFGNNLQALAGKLSEWKGYEAIAEKVKKYGANFRANLMRSQKPIAGELKVLNHGDLWVNNMLFKYDNGRVVDVVFVDFQMSVYGSPGYDLNYFLYTSPRLDVLKQSKETLLRAYHTSLVETLQGCNYADIPGFDQIQTEVRRRAPYGFFANFGIFPAVAMDKSKSADNSLDSFMDEEFALKKIQIMFSSKRLEETMRYTMKEFDKMGALESV